MLINFSAKVMCIISTNWLKYTLEHICVCLGDLMKLSNSSMIKIEDGEYARGKRVQVTNDNQFDATATVLDGLGFLSKIQQPGDEFTLECESILIKSGQATSCQLSLTKDRNKSILF